MHQRLNVFSKSGAAWSKKKNRKCKTLIKRFYSLTDTYVWFEYDLVSVNNKVIQVNIGNV